MGKNPVGSFMVFVERWRYWVSLIQFLLVVLIYLDQSKHPLWWVAIVFVFSLLWTYYIDLKFLAPRFYKKFAQLNPEWNDVVKKVTNEKSSN